MRLPCLVLLGSVGLLIGSGCCKTPNYSPEYWNEEPAVQSNNNCYNYGNNKRTDTYAQPGRRSGAEYGALTCISVRTAAVADGIEVAPSSNYCPHDKDLLALVVDEDFDYHWYRRDTNGMWSHKPGRGMATNLDEVGATISNPETAERCGDYLCYSHFCGYFCSCSSDKEGRGCEKIQ